MGTIEKRGSNSWRVGVKVKDTTTGVWTWQRRTLHFDDTMPEDEQRYACEVALARLIVEADEQAKRQQDAPDDITVSAFADQWMQLHVRPNLSPDTAKNYQFFLSSRILPVLGHRRLCELTPLLLTQWLNGVRTSGRLEHYMDDADLTHKRRTVELTRHDKRRQGPLSPRTVCHYYDTMDAMLDKAVQWDMLPANPMQKVDRPKVKKSRPKTLTEDQAIYLLRCLKSEPNMCYRAALLLALLCGLRLGEVGALRLDDVDWKNGTIDITRALKYTPELGSFEGAPKSEAGERLISLPAGMMAVLYEARTYQEDCAARAEGVWIGRGWIVHGWNGAQLHHDTVSKWFRRFADAHGFEGVRFHDLRHTHASILLANTIDAVSVATRLGHADATVTLRVYAHALRRRDTDASRVMQLYMDAADARPVSDPTEADIDALLLRTDYQPVDAIRTAARLADQLPALPAPAPSAPAEAAQPDATAPDLPRIRPADLSHKP